MIKEQNKTIESLRKTIEELNSNSKILREQIDYLNRKLFGTKSEKTAALTGQIVMDEVFENGQFDEAETEVNPEADAEEDLVLKIKKGILGRRLWSIFQEKKNSIRCRMKTKSAPSMETSFFLLGKNISERKLNIHLHP